MLKHLFHGLIALLVSMAFLAFVAFFMVQKFDIEISIKSSQPVRQGEVVFTQRPLERDFVVNIDKTGSLEYIELEDDFSDEDDMLFVAHGDPKTYDYDANDYLHSGTSTCFEGKGTRQDPYLVDSCDCLQHMGAYQTTLDDYFQLSQNIDCAQTVHWNNGEGFDPIGEPDGQNEAYNFGGTFDGAGFTISNLTINRPTEDRTGIFSRTKEDSIITNVHLENVSVIGKHYVAALVGDSYSIVSRVSVEGKVFSFPGNMASGMITAANRNVIEDSYVSGTVDGGFYVGGMVGSNFGTIARSYSTVDVRGSGGHIGGLVGDSNTIITDSFSVGNVSGGYRVGALLGDNQYGAPTKNAFLRHAQSPVSAIGYEESGYSREETPGYHKMSYFYNPDNAPMNSWDRNSIWSFSNLGLPTLR